MQITFNGVTNPKNMICYTGFPNILKIEQDTSGTFALAYIYVYNSGAINDELTLIINGQTLVSTPYLDKAHGNRFFLSTSNTDAGKLQTAYSLVEAIRSLPAINTNYDVHIETNYDGNQTGGLYSCPAITIKAIMPGPKYNIDITGTYTSKIKLQVSDSSSTNPLFRANDAQLLVDVYKGPYDAKPYMPDYKTSSYVTQLRKTFEGETVYFDLTPLLSSLAEYGEMSNFALHIFSLEDGNPTLLANLGNVFFTTGYSVNQQAPFVSSFNNVLLAQNVQRGEPKPYYNNTLLYIYNPSITLSLYTAQNVNTRTLTIDYYNSAMVKIKTEDYPVVTTNPLTTVTIGLDPDTFEQAHFVTVTIPDLGTLKYDVIKPLKATDENQRVYWTNSMGGTSFFDFTGTRTEQRKTSTKLYQKQNFEFYDTGRNERNLVYDKQVTITVNLTTQFMEKDGTWSLFDLQNSTNAWTEVNGKQYAITINDLKITESNVSGIYNCTATYEYSMGDTY